MLFGEHAAGVGAQVSDRAVSVGLAVLDPHRGVPCAAPPDIADEHEWRVRRIGVWSARSSGGSSPERGSLNCALTPAPHAPAATSRLPLTWRGWSERPKNLNTVLWLCTRRAAKMPCLILNFALVPR